MIPYFFLINLILLLALAILLGWYLWDVFSKGIGTPPSWLKAKSEGRLSPALQKAWRNYPDKARFFAWWTQIERIECEKIPGAFAELGVYKGESAKAIHLMAPGRRLHLFDSFGGFTKADLSLEKGEAANYQTSDFSDTDPNKVFESLGRSDLIFIHHGNFPETTKGLVNEQFAFVNLDADLYRPTRDALEFFYPRLSPGGLIFIHDYNHKWEGLRKAVDDFCSGIPEVGILLPDREGTVLIARNRS
jgi:O-methyltransferase